MKKLLKLLRPLGECARRYYKFEGGTTLRFLLLSRYFTEMAGMKTYENLARIAVVVISSEKEEVEGLMRTLEVSSWMDGLSALYNQISCDCQLRGGD